jgi:hypothetical protein
MLRKTLSAIVLAAFTATAGLEFAALPASAAMPYGAIQYVEPNSNVQLTGAWVYVPGKHGNRYNYKRKGYGYYYGGWWYKKPWWTYGPGPGPWVWSKKYGPRYAYKRPGYGYYYGGWWYPKPYWRPGFSVCIGC